MPTRNVFDRLQGSGTGNLTGKHQKNKKSGLFHNSSNSNLLTEERRKSGIYQRGATPNPSSFSNAVSPFMKVEQHAE